jgi:N-acetylmuramoyl-L-alanine amidase
MSKTIIIDPGHGGFDAGASFQDRKEKDDTLRLALAVGQNLEKAGYTIYYTRTDDRYDSPYDKAQIANSTGGDLFLSFHRNFAEKQDLYQGVQALVYDKSPVALRVAKDINEELEKVGFSNLGIESRKELVVLRRTKMPAVLLEVGFINSIYDNELFDERFPEIVNAIATGVKMALPISSASVSSDAYVETMAPVSIAPDSVTLDSAHTSETPKSPTVSEVWETSVETTAPASSTATSMTSTSDSHHSFAERLQAAMLGSASSGYSDAAPPAPDTMPCPSCQPKPMPYGTPPVPMPDQRPMHPTPADIPGTTNPNPNLLYYVQVGLFKNPENAVYLMEQLKQQGYESIWKRIGGFIAIWVGPVETLDETVALQVRLRTDGYETLIVTDEV